MSFKFDDVNIEGLLSIDGYIDINNRTPEDIACLILQRIDGNETLRLHSSTSNLLAARDEIELVLDVDFEAFTPERERSFLRALSLLLNDADVRIRRKRPGNSTILTLDLTSQQWNILKQAIERGELAEFKPKALLVNGVSVIAPAARPTVADTIIKAAMHTSQRVYKPFFNVFVVWHPDFGTDGATGRAVAEMFYREFCRDPERPMSPAVGVPIYFRTSQHADVAPPPIDFNSAHHNVVVLLVDSSMVLDEAYRRFAQDLAQAATEPHNRLFAFQFPGAGRLPLGNLQQITLPQAEAERTAKLRLIFASECCRLLQHRPRGGEGGAQLSPEPPQLFISYAKRDAEEQAEDLKALVEKTHVDTFFDKVDIALGYDFTAEIRESIKRSVVLAWQSDEYASRPWCNIELLTAKESLRPIVVVLGVKSGEERSFPYLGNVRTIVATGGNSTEIIIAAVREYLRKLYAEGRFTSLSDAGLIPPARFHLFRPPEPIDGALLERKTQPSDSDEAPTASAREQWKEWVFYPDPPLCTAESDMLARLFPHIQFVTPATLDRSSLNGMRVALSISASKDLGHFGVSPLHLVSTMIEVARHALCHGAVIAYGGDLRERRQYGFTRQLFELVHAYDDLGRQRLERIRNFLAYHIAAELPKDEEARLIELATFVKPLPQNVVDRFQLDVDKRQTIPDDTPDTSLYSRAVSNSDARGDVSGDGCPHHNGGPGVWAPGEVSGSL